YKPAELKDIFAPIREEFETLFRLTFHRDTNKNILGPSHGGICQPKLIDFSPTYDSCTEDCCTEARTTQRQDGYLASMGRLGSPNLSH
ncbi:unnamed protein product, partial [Allacma fusca]